MAQIFVESIFSKHINWTELVMNDDNFKNILQVKIQKEFKVTPHYLQDFQNQESYKMGVYLCLGQAIHEASLAEAMPITHFHCVEDMHKWQTNHQGKLFVYLGHGEHKIKRKAEQEACFNALQYLRTLLPDTLLSDTHIYENT
jgi:dsRNA-specific ribonuclease